MTPRTKPRIDDASGAPFVGASILSADFARLGDEITDVLDAGADIIHVDVMDGHFVPNLSMGPAIVSSVRKAFPDAYLDVHLMVADPDAWFRPFAQAGADLLSFHIEVCADEREALAHADRVRALGCAPGIAINPPTPQARLEPVASAFDLVLAMSVMPGHSGQAFMPEALERGALRSALPATTRLEIDGGVNPENAATVREAGFDLLVAASAIFGRPSEDRPGVICQLKGSE
ncbi:MAG: ribulose-phosphate 3-epimerase [Phycisphaeraceae bacterium]|nr:MAG: ribulose-phosphate 3-epimerase [Phycisphaeraceae bacterium]